VAVVLIGAIWLLINALRGKRPPAHPRPRAQETGVIDGEFTVVRDGEGDRGIVIEHATQTAPSSKG
jgi:hypothetical protein